MTTSDKPVYLPHRTIPKQLQGEVRKCLDTWLRQGIIHPSKSPYASQVVIVRKKTGEIWLCVDYHKLNSIVVRDAFPLPQIDEALQAVNNCQWFTSFDLAQVIYRCQWQSQIFIKWLSELDHLACMNLPACRSDYPTQVQVSAT